MKRGRIILTLIAAISLILIPLIFLDNLIITGQISNEPLPSVCRLPDNPERYSLNLITGIYPTGFYPSCNLPYRQNINPCYGYNTNGELSSMTPSEIISSFGGYRCCPTNEGGVGSIFDRALYEKGNACCNDVPNPPDGRIGENEIFDGSVLSKAYDSPDEYCCVERKPQQLLDIENPPFFSWEYKEKSKIIKIEDEMCCTVSDPVGVIGSITKAVPKDYGDTNCCAVSRSQTPENTFAQNSITDLSIETYNNQNEECCTGVGIANKQIGERCCVDSAGGRRIIDITSNNPLNCGVCENVCGIDLSGRNTCVTQQVGDIILNVCTTDCNNLESCINFWENLGYSRYA